MSLVVFGCAGAQISHLTVDDGLAQNSVYAIAQDHFGYVWFGTGDGLNKYDGFAVTVYRHHEDDSLSLPRGTVRFIHEDRHGQLWIGTDHGLCRYDPEHSGFIDAVEHSIHKPRVRTSSFESVAEDSAGVLWFGTGEGVVRFDDRTKTMTSFPFKSATSSQTLGVYSLTNAPSGILLAGTSIGVVAFDTKTEQWRLLNKGDLHVPGAQVSTHAYSLYLSTKGDLWYGCNGELRRYQYRENTYSSTRLAEDLADTFYVSSICEDRHGNIYVGTFNHGVVRYDPSMEKKEYFCRNRNIAGSLTNDIVRAVFADRLGTVWIGTDGGGVNILRTNSKPFVHVAVQSDKPNGLSDNFIKSLFEDSRGRLWIGTGGAGLDCYERNQDSWKHFRHSSLAGSIASDYVTALLEDTARVLWIGTDHGLNRLDPTTDRWKTILFEEPPHSSSSKNFVTAIRRCTDTSLWIGTRNGFYLLRTRTFTATWFPSNASTAAFGRIHSLYQDGGGILWVAAENAGLIRFDRLHNQWTQFRHRGGDQFSLAHNNVRTICEYPAGTLWLGTDIGLEKFAIAAGRFAHYGEQDGLPNPYVYSILADDASCLWISTNKGLSRFDIKTARFRNFEKGDGLQANEFNSGAAWKTTSGELLFGGVNGFNIFRPSDIKDNPFPPPVVLTSLAVMDIPIAIDSLINCGTPLVLSYDRNNFSVGFAALEFTDPAKNQYAYKMEGYDADWQYCGTIRSARYVNVADGEYVLRVKASNNDGIWNKEGASLRIIIVPPIWKRWWFLVLLAGAGLTLLVMLIQYNEYRKVRRRIEQLEQERALERERERISRDMHDEIGSALTQIAIMSELAHRNVKEQSLVDAQLQKISERSRDVIDSMSEIVWAINPKNDALESLIAYLREFVGEYLESAGIDYHCATPDLENVLKLRAEERRNIFLVVKEALHNIVKHAGATSVEVSFTLKGKILRIVIHDNGAGFDMSSVHAFGNGLINMRKRMEEIDGSFTISSMPGKGTTIVLEKAIPA